MSTNLDTFDFLSPAQAPDEMGRLGPYRVLTVLGTRGMGRGVSGRGPAAAAHRRAEGDAAGGGEAARGTRALPARSPRHRQDRARPHRHHLPGRRRPGRAVSGHATAQGHVARSLPEEKTGQDRQAAAARLRDQGGTRNGEGAGRGARKGADSPRHQAREHLAGCECRRARQDSRFWTGPRGESLRHPARRYRCGPASTAPGTGAQRLVDPVPISSVSVACSTDSAGGAVQAGCRGDDAGRLAEEPPPFGT